MDDNVCPICLEIIQETDNILCMPVCGHKIHTLCELAAAQYDTRCPVCRTKDPELCTKIEEPTIYDNIERLTRERQRIIMSYRRRRNRLIGKNTKLASLREREKQETQNLNMKNKELEQAWSSFQRKAWMENSDIGELKKERQRVLRRLSSISKALDNAVEGEIGPQPDDVIFLQLE